MNDVTASELQQNSNSVLDRVEAGESLTITRNGRPVAEVRPIHRPQLNSRPFGLCRGTFVVPDDFNAPLPDTVLREFEGS